jgi:hypothetical protein
MYRKAISPSSLATDWSTRAIDGSPNVNLHNILEPVGASVPTVYGRVHGGLGRRNGIPWLNHGRPPFLLLV